MRVRLSFSLSRPPSLLKPSVALKARGGGKPRRGSKTLAAPNCKFHPKNDGLHGRLIVRREKNGGAPFSVLWEAALLALLCKVLSSCQTFICKVFLAVSKLRASFMLVLTALARSVGAFFCFSRDGEREGERLFGAHWHYVTLPLLHALISLFRNSVGTAAVSCGNNGNKFAWKEKESSYARCWRLN